jgi:hypothetical protein
MSTYIDAVNDLQISSCLLIDLTLDGTTYYLSSAYKPLTYNSNTYTELGSFLTVGTFREDIRTTNGDITVALSGIPSEQNYLSIILNTPIKGGEISIYRAFFDLDTHELRSDTGAVVLRFKGIINNFAITEDADTFGQKFSTNSVAITCASINTILENRTAGQRTDPDERKRLFTNDAVFNRVPELYNVSFDFGKEYQGGGGYGRGGSGRGGGGGGGGRNRRIRDEQQR